MNKKEDKFKIVSEDELSPVNDIEIVDVPKEVAISKDDYKEVRNIVMEETKNKRINKRPHFSFKYRIFIMIVLILLLLGGAGILGYEAIHYSKSDSATYEEASEMHYKVCTFGEDYICVDEGNMYNSSDIQSINITFDYNIEFSKSTYYDFNYYVTSVTKIYDKSNSKVIYNNKDILVDSTNISDNKKSLNIYKDVTYDYNKDNKFVVDYKDTYSNEYTADVEVALYIRGNGKIKKVSSITIPLNTNDFNIEKYDISNTNNVVNNVNDGWSKYSIMCAVIASVLVFISLILIYRVTHIIIKITNNRSRYQQRLDDIFKKYDSIIVIARDGYETNVVRDTVKLDSFDKLLDVKDRVNKPIIFSKINDIKSEFIVEDEDKLYKYVLKDTE